MGNFDCAIMIVASVMALHQLNTDSQAQRCGNAEVMLQFPAKPFWEDASAESKARAEGGNPPDVSQLFRRQRRISWGGMLAMLFYMCALGFYLWIRVTKTLGLGPYL